MIEASLEQLASEAAGQRATDFPPEDFRLQWEDSYAPLNGHGANEGASVGFSAAELSELRDFNEFVWALPPKPHAMWHRDSLDADPWPQVRLRARRLLALMRAKSDDSPRAE